MGERVAVVTGANSGVGLAVARRLANDRVSVVLVDVEDPQRHAESIGAQNALAVAANVADEAEVDRVFDRCWSAYGRLDYLVNCAAVDRVNTVVGASLEEWDWIIGVNLKGVFLCCRSAIPLIAQSGGGAIVNIGSTQGYRGGPGAAIYCASKGGVHQLTKCMAIDHADEGVRVNCIAPGAIDTPMFEREISQQLDPEKARKRAADVPLQRIASPDEIAAVVCFLLSDKASYVTGAIVTVDGGGSA